MEHQDAPSGRDVVALREAAGVWLLISLQTFGGPAGQIAVMQRTLVEERRWIGQRRFLHALNYCMLLPGPEAQQLAIYIGWLLNGVRGGMIAGVLFVLPGMAALLALSAIYVGFGDTDLVRAVFAGLGPAVVAIVAQAVLRIGRRSLTHPLLIGIALGAFVALSAFAIPFPVVIAVAAVVGWLAGRKLPGFHAGTQGGQVEGPAPLIPDEALHTEAPSSRRTVTILAVGLIMWATPIVISLLVTGTGSVFTQQGLFFSFTALVTFGGAYAVLAFVAQQAVASFGWLSPGDMVRGLALAETTPGPLIMVVQFVAFLGAFHHAGTVDPWLAGVLGSLLTTWVTFVPCFLFIFLGAPHIERLRSNAALSAALTGITAAVVGVIANLGVYFATTTLFIISRTLVIGSLSIHLPDVTSLRPVQLGIAVIAAILIFAAGWPLLRVLGACTVLGLTAGLAGLPLT